ncbi:formyl transferase [Massilia sp. PAMC28688]|uniref:formyl transferase n=1 Tax=Massilia sp. PAMC28688 TaxID=2861283 RepID=UPI001C62F3EC|nr:formyl transferase [Massilia sp. PAMC28688]QYF91985.1 formyl transferase [Massilia sp. PAMC28688]
MKLIVLATDSDSTWMLVNSLMPYFPDLKVVLETPIGRATLLKRRLARLGWWTVAGQVLFMLLLPVLRRSGQQRREALLAAAGLACQAPAIALQRFASVNDPDCRQWLAAQDPDVVILNGTRIVSPQVLDSCRAVFLNTHCGITPAYRGVHGGYWALYQGQPHLAGVTVHVVDRGIDTGDIIYQSTFTAEPGDNFLTYPVKQYIAGIPLMQRALEDIAADKLVRHRRADLTSAVWYHPTLWQYLGARWRRGVA